MKIRSPLALGTEEIAQVFGEMQKMQVANGTSKITWRRTCLVDCFLFTVFAYHLLNTCS